MSGSSSDRDPLEVLAEEFAARLRAGEHPSVGDYAARHPALAEQIRELFPALAEVELLKPDSADLTGPFAPAADPPAPERLGDFRVLRQVGRGGMGVVYEAVQESLGRHVALKVLPPEAVADPRRLERFRREAQAAAKLHHTNIVPVFGTGEAGGRHFYAMQFIPGQGLDAVIGELRRLKQGPSVTPAGEVAASLATGSFASATRPPGSGEPAPAAGPSDPPASSGSLSGTLSDGGRGYWSAAARLGAQAAEALAYAHGQGVLHRDVKPSNLLLDRHGTLWVADFGLAKSAGADDLTAAGDVVGTLRYLAPERFDGPGDARSDVYALGLTLYELLVLRPAFDADSRPRLVEQVLAASPPAPRKVNPSIPRDLETVVLKAIARDPAARYQSAGELAEDLRRFLDDRPVLARRASSAEQAWRWCRRNPAVASLLAAVLLVFAAGAGGSLYFAAGEAKRAREASDNLALAHEREKDAIREWNRANDGANQARKERDHARGLLHVNQINLAQAALADNRISRVLELLDATTPKTPQEPDLRGWEWHYLDRLVRGRVLAEFDATVSSDAFISPSGRLATVRGEGDLQVLDVWDTRTGRKLGQFPKPGGAPLAKPARYALAPDGRSVAAVTAEPPEKGGAPPRERVRLWEVETGVEIPGPPVPMPAWWMRLGPDAAWITWVHYSPPPPQQGAPGQDALTVVRWDRASGAVTRTSLAAFPDYEEDWRAWLRATRQRLAVQTAAGAAAAGAGPTKAPPKLLVSGGSSSSPHLAPDGQTFFRLASRQRVWEERASRDGKEQGPPTEEAETFLECWDLTASPPRLRWPVVRIGKSIHGNEGSRNERDVFSPGCTAFASHHRSGSELAVFRLSDGKELWRTPCTQTGELFGVSDDGSRVAFATGLSLTVLEKRGPEAPRELVFPHGAAVVNGQGRTILSADGRTVLIAPRENRVRVLDVARDAASAALADAGRLRLLRPDADDGKAVMGRRGRRDPAFNPAVVVDADGGEVARIEAPPARHRLYARLVAGDRRLLTVTWMQAADDEDAPKSESHMWALYDLTRPGRPERVAGGPGFVSAPPGTPWLVVSTMIRVERPRRAGPPATLSGRSWALHDVLTGERVRQVGKWTDADRWVGPTFDPTGARYALVTRPPDDGKGEPYQPRWPATLRMCEAKTGRELWSHEIAGTGWMPLYVSFSPDGRRVFVKYEGPGPNGQLLRQVWVHRTDDGARERTLQLPPDRPGEVGGVVGVASDGRLITWTSASGRFRPEVQLWDPDAGKPTHTLPGHDGGITWAATTPDGKRLFVRAGNRLHLWDLTVSRELLVLPIQLDNPGLIADGTRGEWFDGQRLIIPGSQSWQIFDGSPQGP